MNWLDPRQGYIGNLNKLLGEPKINKNTNPLKHKNK